jgi:hypothetical protein
MREKLETLALVLGLSLIGAGAVVWVVEEALATHHQDRICGNGEGRGRGAQVFKGAWTHRVPELGKERTLDQRVAYCRAQGYRPHP